MKTAPVAAVRQITRENVMRYLVDLEIFHTYPLFRRAVLIARGMDNSTEVPEVLALLRESETSVQGGELASPYEHPRLKPWADAFSSMHLNPKRYPPSVINLVKRVRKGTMLPYVNTLVALFNCMSLRHLIPCGGDDLDAVTGDLCLTFAKGDEDYVPLAQPDVLEHPPVGEVIYMDSGNRDVFCRAWCWKNGDRSKLLPTTTRAAINLDMMTEHAEAELPSIAEELAGLLKNWTGASVDIHYISPENPSFDID